MPLLLHVLHLSYTAGLLLRIESCITTKQALLCQYHHCTQMHASCVKIFACVTS